MVTKPLTHTTFFLKGKKPAEQNALPSVARFLSRLLTRFSAISNENNAWKLGWKKKECVEPRTKEERLRFHCHHVFFWAGKTIGTSTAEWKENVFFILINGMCLGFTFPFPLSRYIRFFYLGLLTAAIIPQHPLPFEWKKESEIHPSNSERRKEKWKFYSELICKSSRNK